MSAKLHRIEGRLFTTDDQCVAFTIHEDSVAHYSHTHEEREALSVNQITESLFHAAKPYFEKGDTITPEDKHILEFGRRILALNQTGEAIAGHTMDFSTDMYHVMRTEMTRYMADSIADRPHDRDWFAYSRAHGIRVWDDPETFTITVNEVVFRAPNIFTFFGTFNDHSVTEEYAIEAYLEDAGFAEFDENLYDGDTHADAMATIHQMLKEQGYFKLAAKEYDAMIDQNIDSLNEALASRTVQHG